MCPSVYIIDKAALSLLDPNLPEQPLWAIIDECPQALNYIKLDECDGDEWGYFLVRQPDIVENLCSEYGGWAKLNKDDWHWLLIYQPRLRKYKKQYFNN